MRPLCSRTLRHRKCHRSQYWSSELGKDATTSIGGRVNPSEWISHWQSAPVRASAPHEEHLQQLL